MMDSRQSVPYVWVMTMAGLVLVDALWVFLQPVEQETPPVIQVTMVSLPAMPTPSSAPMVDAPPSPPPTPPQPVTPPLVKPAIVPARVASPSAKPKAKPMPPAPETPAPARPQEETRKVLEQLVQQDDARKREEEKLIRQALAASEQRAAKPQHHAPIPPSRQELEEKGNKVLQRAEKGRGPAIEIAWPEEDGEREQLYRAFRCQGMQTVLVTDDRRLYRMEDPPGQGWSFDRHLYSVYFRFVDRPAAQEEQQAVKRLGSRHGFDGSVARVFPRHLDAVLLGYLADAAENLPEAKSIRARYALAGNRIVVQEAMVDGQAVQGTFVLATWMPGC